MSQGIGPNPSTIIHLTEVDLSVASIPWSPRQETDHVRGLDPLIVGAYNSLVHSPSVAMVEVILPPKRRSILQSNSRTSP